jgi:hypothetical protein
MSSWVQIMLVVLVVFLQTACTKQPTTQDVRPPFQESDHILDRA